MSSPCADATDLTGARSPNFVPAKTHLEELRVAFRDMQLSLDPPVILRSVWICPNVAAWRLLEVWLKDRHSRDGLSTEAFLVARLEDAVCAFEETELDAVRNWTDFVEIGHFEDNTLAAGR